MVLVIANYMLLNKKMFPYVSKIQMWVLKGALFGPEPDCLETYTTGSLGSELTGDSHLGR